MAEQCQFLKVYNTGNGSVSYCELAAFNQPVNPDFLEKIGCTAERRKECSGGNGLNINNPAPLPLLRRPRLHRGLLNPHRSLPDDGRRSGK